MDKSVTQVDEGKISAIHLYLFIMCVGILCLARMMATGPMLSSNDRSRWCTIRALVTQKTYVIDQVITNGRWDTIDKVRHEGHFYSSKLPLFSTILAGFVYPLLKITGWNFDQHLWQIQVVTLLFINLLPFLISIWCLGRLVSHAGSSVLAQWLIVVIYALGTAVTPFLGTLNNHAPATIAVIFTLWGMYHAGSSRGSYSSFVITGFFAAWTCTLELPAGLLGVWSFAVCVWSSRLKTLLGYVPSAIVPLAGHFYTNYLVTGGFKPFYAYYGTEKYVYEFWGIPSYWSEPAGIDQALDTFSTYLFHCTLGHHGIFSLTPIFLLAFMFWVLCWAYRNYPLWNLSVIGGIVSLIVLGFYMTRTQNYNYSGSSVSLRWMMWTIPFFLLAALPVVNSLTKHVVGVLCLSVLMTGSIFSAWYPLTNPWHQPWIFQLMEAKGLIDYKIKPKSYSHAHRIIFDQLATTAGIDPDYWVEFGYMDSFNKIKTFKLQDDGEVNVDGVHWRKILITGALPGVTSDAAIPMLIPVNAFTNETQQKVEFQFPGSTSIEIADEVEQFLHGLPGVKVEEPKDYKPGIMQYLFLPLRKDALRTQYGYQEITQEFSDEKIPNPGYRTFKKYKSEIWNTEELPFGLARWQYSISNTIDSADANKLTISAIRAGKIMPRK
jgi:hypothetical protein